MTPEQLGEILAFAATIDPRVGSRDEEVTKAITSAWYLTIGDLPAGDVRDAMVAHYRESGERVMPADVRRRVSEVRRARLAVIPSDEVLMADVEPFTHQWIDEYKLRRAQWADGVHPSQVAAAQQARAIEGGHR